MKPVVSRPRRRFAGLGVFPALCWAAVFAAAAGQVPFYYSNQHQYLLHGLAAAGRGDLAHDWLANTLDPTPVFSTGVAWLSANVGEWSFPASYAALQGIYFVSLVALIEATLGLPRSRPARFVLLTLLVAVNSVAARWVSLYVSGTLLPEYLHRPLAAIDMPRYMQHGLASQYLLGPGLQPSAFGVLLVTSMAAFVRGRLVLAALCAAIACTVHAAYLLPAAFLTVAYMGSLIRDDRWGTAFLLGLGTLLLVSPVVYYNWTTFGPTTPDQYAEAQRLLVDVRIKHHAVVTEWFDRFAKCQLAWLAAGVLFGLPTRLFGLMFIPALLGTLLTLVQVAPSNPALMDWLRNHGVGQEVLDQLTTYGRTLALLFPWRISAVLIPVATAVIVRRLVQALTPYPYRPRWWGWVARLGAAALLAVVVAFGLDITLREPGLVFPAEDNDGPLLALVEGHRRPGDEYLIPPEELERFRLRTGAAVYVDWKSIPYKDVEVLEWNRRFEQARKWYVAGDWDTVHDEMAKAGVTNVVIPAANAPASAKTLEREDKDGAYSVYRLRR